MIPETTQAGDLIAFTIDFNVALIGNTIANETNGSVRVRPLGGKSDGSDDQFVFAPNWSVIKSLNQLTQPR